MELSAQALVFGSQDAGSSCVRENICTVRTLLVNMNRLYGKAG